jgi:N-acetylglucosaminyl-diphospho-decaprenol L-rhamnosyltransferase
MTTNLSLEIPVLSISIVSHGQGALVGKLIQDIAKFSYDFSLHVVLTKNISEELPFRPEEFPFSIEIIENSSPKGFGANHNAAFKRTQGKWFCIMNPDILLPINPFSRLIEEIEQAQGAVIAPAVLSMEGLIEDSVRRFPTPLSIIMKALGLGDGRYPFGIGDEAFVADWVGGMFMLFRSEDYRSIDGFDERFFLYYEDVDICARLRKADHSVVACPKAYVIHDARRTSHRKLRYMRWHATSMLRYLGKHWLPLPSKASH